MTAEEVTIKNCMKIRVLDVQDKTCFNIYIYVRIFFYLNNIFADVVGNDLTFVHNQIVEPI